jgi:hypothetical protein
MRIWTQGCAMLALGYGEAALRGYVSPYQRALKGHLKLRPAIFEVALQATIICAPKPRAALRLPWAMVRPPLRGYGTAQSGALSSDMAIRLSWHRRTRPPLRGYFAAKGQRSAFTLSIASH